MMNEWDLQQKVETWCRTAWNNLGLGALQGEMQKLRAEIAKCNQEMSNAHTASSAAVSSARQSVAKAEDVVKEVLARMDDLEEEQANFSEVVKEAKDKADKALEESEKKNQPIVIKTGEGWDWGSSGWTTNARYGDTYVLGTSYGHTAIAQQMGDVAAQLATQGVAVTPQMVNRITEELARAQKQVAAVQDKFNKGEK